jgi:hypothetical protein
MNMKKMLTNFLGFKNDAKVTSKIPIPSDENIHTPKDQNQFNEMVLFSLLAVVAGCLLYYRNFVLMQPVR